MAEMMSAPMDGEKKKYKRWSKSTEMDGITKSVEVREVENGYIIKKSMYGKKEGSDEYMDECREYISMTNPMDKNKDKEIDKEEHKKMDMMDSIKSMFGEKDMY